MFSFKNDYSEGAHPDILDALVRSNGDQEDGYGEDRHTLAAIEKIRNLIGDPKTDVHLLSGGTDRKSVV